MFRSALFVLSVVCALASAAPAAGVLKTVEAERCDIVCASREPRDSPSQFASANAMAPAQWGMAAGDSIAWEEHFFCAAGVLKLGIRYAFDRADFERRHGEGLPDELALFVDDVRLEVALPSTRQWDNFETVLVELPLLGEGTHRFRLEAIADHSDRNVDCFHFLRGELDDIPIGLRQTIVATSEDGFFELWTAPETILPHTPEYLFESCRRIYDFLADQTAFEPDTKSIGIHVRPHKHVGGYQFQNARGIWFSDDPGSCSITGWVHELNHFFQPHMAGWMCHPFVRVNDAMVVPQELFPGHVPDVIETNPWFMERWQRGREFLGGKLRTTDDPHTIAFALHVKYGPELQRRFYHLVAEDVAAGRLAIRPDERLDAETFVHYLSRAAGEDVRPLFVRLEGFPDDVRRYE